MTGAADLHRLYEVRTGQSRYLLCLPDPENDTIQHHIATTGRPYEEQLVSDLAQRLEAGSLVIDVGANVGNHSIAWAAAGLDVVAYEPHPDLASALRSSASQEGLKGSVEVLQKAVLDEVGRARLVGMTPQNMGTGHLEASREDGIEVEVTTLTAPDRPVRALKVDTEGTEARVLRGAVQLLQRDHPLLYVECLDLAAFLDVWQIVSELGYGYCDTFNSSPTHLFVWLGDSGGGWGAQTGAPLLALMSRFYADHDAWVATREQLRAANSKYRGVTATLGQMQARLEQAEQLQAREREEAQAEHVGSSAEVIRAHEELQRALALVGSLEEQLLGSQRNAGAWSDELARRNQAVSQLQRENGALAQRNCDLDAVAAELRAQLEQRGADHRGQLQELRLAASQRAAETDQERARAQRVEVELQSVQKLLDAALDDHAREREALLEELSARSLALSQARELLAAHRQVSGMERPSGTQAPTSDAVLVPRADWRYLREWLAQRQDEDQETARQLAASRDAAAEKDAELAQANRTLEQVRGRAERLRREAQGLHEERRVLRAQVADAARWRSERDEARLQLVKQEQLAERLETQKRQLRHELTLLRRSRTMRVGREVSRTRGPVAILTLPWRLYTVGRRPASKSPKEIEK